MAAHIAPEKKPSSKGKRNAGKTNTASTGNGKRGRPATKKAAAAAPSKMTVEQMFDTPLRELADVIPRVDTEPFKIEMKAHTRGPKSIHAGDLTHKLLINDGQKDILLDEYVALAVARSLMHDPAKTLATFVEYSRANPTAK